jgi:hypothetical protein
MSSQFSNLLIARCPSGVNRSSTFMFISPRFFSELPHR